ncbi:hypothetical protein ACUOFC_56575, partial [Escherichia sp. TWPC-MK]
LRYSSSTTVLLAHIVKILLFCPLRYWAFTLQTAVSQEREENRLPHYDNESEENRRARRIP